MNSCRLPALLKSRGVAGWEAVRDNLLAALKQLDVDAQVRGGCDCAVAACISTDPTCAQCSCSLCFCKVLAASTVWQSCSGGLNHHLCRLYHVCRLPLQMACGLQCSRRRLRELMQLHACCPLLLATPKPKTSQKRCAGGLSWCEHSAAETRPPVACGYSSTLQDPARVCLCLQRLQQALLMYAVSHMHACLPAACGPAGD